MYNILQTSLSTSRQYLDAGVKRSYGLLGYKEPVESEPLTNNEIKALNYLFSYATKKEAATYRLVCKNWKQITTPFLYTPIAMSGERDCRSLLALFKLTSPELRILIPKEQLPADLWLSTRIKTSIFADDPEKYSKRADELLYIIETNGRSLIEDDIKTLTKRKCRMYNSDPSDLFEAKYKQDVNFLTESIKANLHIKEWRPDGLKHRDALLALLNTFDGNDHENTLGQIMDKINGTELKNDRDVITKILQLDHNLITYYKEFFNDAGFMSFAFAIHPATLQYVKEEFQTDRDFWLNAFKKYDNMDAIKYLCHKFQEKQPTLFAKYKATMITHHKDKLGEPKENKPCVPEFMAWAITLNPNVINYADINFTSDIQNWLAAFRQYRTPEDFTLLQNLLEKLQPALFKRYWHTVFEIRKEKFPHNV